MTFTLTGTLQDHALAPLAAASLVIIPTPSTTVDAAGDVIHLGGTSLTTDATGSFTATLVHSPDLHYTIRTVGGRLAPVRFACSEITDGATVDLADLTPQPAPSPMADYVRGASAYEVWLEQGNAGTEADFLASLSVASTASHESILLGATATLPVTHPVLTVRATEASIVAVDDAPDGTVVTIHVAHGWENITWAEGVAVTGETDTTEMWVVLVRTEGEWKALVSGAPAVGGGGVVVGSGPPFAPFIPGTWDPTTPVEPALGLIYLNNAYNYRELWVCIGETGQGRQDWALVYSKDRSERGFSVSAPKLYPGGYPVSVSTLPAVDTLIIRANISDTLVDGEVLVTFTEPDAFSRLSNFTDMVIPVTTGDWNNAGPRTVHYLRFHSEWDEVLYVTTWTLVFMAGHGPIPGDESNIIGRVTAVNRMTEWPGWSTG